MLPGDHQGKVRKIGGEQTHTCAILKCAIPVRTSRCQSLECSSGCGVPPETREILLSNQSKSKINTVSMSLHWHLLLQRGTDTRTHQLGKRCSNPSVSEGACVLPEMRPGGWRCGGPGRATGDTARVYTSAGDCIEGVSSAGGVKSVSSSKWSSNSCVQLRQNITNLPDVTLSGCCARTPTLKLISLSLQQVTQFTSNTTKATRAASDTTRDAPRDRDSVSPVPPPEIRKTDPKYDGQYLDF